MSPGVFGAAVALQPGFESSMSTTSRPWVESTDAAIEARVARAAGHPHLAGGDLLEPVGQLGTGGSV